jgi:hypothetical protein
MSLRPKCLVFLASTLLIFAALPVNAQFYDLEVKVADAEGYPGQTNAEISVIMKNYADTVAGFELWLYLENVVVCEFQTELDTIHDTAYYRCTTWVGPGECEPWGWFEVTDSVLMDPGTQYDTMIVNVYELLVGSHRTEGTLVETWEEVTSASIGTGGHDLKIIGRANTIPPPYTPGIGYPQYGQLPLIRVLADIYDIPPDQEEQSVRIFIQHDNLDNFSFSDEDGNGIGVITDTNLDTSWYNCVNWNEDSTFCGQWQEVPSGPADSFWCCDTVLSGHLDTSIVNVKSGVLYIIAGLCGDVNCSESINLLDITYLIQYLYKGGPPPCDEWRADVNGSGGINLLDITYMINYLYKGGPEPSC